LNIINEQNQSTLNQAIKFLEYASMQLTMSDPEHSECLNLLVESASNTEQLDFEKLMNTKKIFAE